MSTRNTADLIQEYLHLTRDAMPALAKQRNAEQGREGNAQWPVQHDHCFQRIVLDNICGGAWYDYIKAPAYQHLSPTQADAAVRLCHQIIGGEADLKQLNERSFKWRQKQYRFSF
ncbi:hypothetical protein ACFO4O_02155 [Glaciecola siphonariae]|uniref:GCN5-related N-acetyltransferase n=1 Tax=Glaciecola siphonariae TaxID=521012 RepID=A0ABV9LTH7_9ALTE